MKKRKALILATNLLIMTGAAKTVCSAADYSLYIDINFVGNLIFSTYDIDFYIDDEKIDTIPHGEDYTHLIDNIEEGYHTIKFCSVDSPDVSGEDIIEIKNDMTFRCTLFAHSDEVVIDDAKTEDGINETTAQTGDDTESNPVSATEGLEETETEKTTEILSESEETEAALPNIDYSEKDIVILVQEALNEQGYDCGSADGVPGEHTRNSISHYRTEKGLPEGEQIDFELVNSLSLIPQIQEKLAQQNAKMTQEE